MVEQDKEWSEALGRERSLRSKVLNNARDDMDDGGITCREWWGAVERLLYLYSMAIADNRTVEPPPAEVLIALKDLAGYLAVGTIPEPIAEVTVTGRQAAGPRERHDIGVAVAYLRAANEGFTHNGKEIFVSDPHPTKTVAEAFGVDRRTVQGWRKQRPPASLGMNDANAKVLYELMINAGKRAGKRGRGADAVRNRDAKRGERNPKG